MVRLSSKTIVNKAFSPGQSIPSDFTLSDHEATVRDKGLSVIWEKAYMCPCKEEKADHLNICKNCGGTGWIFCNPTKTKMLIQSIQLDGKLKEAALREWGMIDLGTVKITALNSDKISYMDRITVSDVLVEHSQILYPSLSSDQNESESDSGLEGQLFAYTKYDIESVDYIGLFEGAAQPLKKLEEPADYTFRDNVLLLGAQYDSLTTPSVTIRYKHNPVFHVTDLLRAAFTSTVNPIGSNHQKISLPTLSLGKVAHLIEDVENFNGDRLFDNSWLPSACQTESLTKFQRQLRNASAQDIYDTLTTTQRVQLLALLS